MQDTTQISRNFYDHAAHDMWQRQSATLYHMGYFKNSESLKEAQLNLVSELISPLDIQEEQLILDIGCGRGSVAYALANKFKVHVTGITISESQLSLCRQYQKKNPALNFELMDAHQLSFPDNHFDHAYAMESLLHMQREIVLDKLYKQLKPKAKFSLCDWYIKKPLSKLEESYAKEVLGANYLSSQEYIQTCATAGFSDIEFVDWTEQTEKTYEYWNQTSNLKAQGASQDYISEFESISNNLTQFIQEKMGYCMITATKENLL